MGQSCLVKANNVHRSEGRLRPPGTQILALTLPSSVTLGKILTLSEPQLPLLKMKTTDPLT